MIEQLYFLTANCIIDLLAIFVHRKYAVLPSARNVERVKNFDYVRFRIAGNGTVPALDGRGKHRDCFFLQISVMICPEYKHTPAASKQPELSVDSLFIILRRRISVFPGCHLC